MYKTVFCSYICYTLLASLLIHLFCIVPFAFITRYRLSLFAKYTLLLRQMCGSVQYYRTVLRMGETHTKLTIFERWTGCPERRKIWRICCDGDANADLDKTVQYSHQQVVLKPVILLWISLRAPLLFTTGKCFNSVNDIRLPVCDDVSFVLLYEHFW